MNTIKINSYKDLENIEIKNDFIVDLTNCEAKDKKRVFDFLCGLTFLNGSISKISKNQFAIHLAV